MPNQEANTNPQGTAANRAPAGPGTSRLTSFLVITLFVVIGHAWAIQTGLYLDDHAHFEHLSRDDWSFRSAVDASRLGIIGEVIDLWGRSEAGLTFFRPVAFWIMKLEYTVAHWNPMVMHLFSLGWHLACSLLVAALAMRCFGRRFWAMVAGALMAIHPGHMATVYWVACQTELMSTTFLLIGILAYARHAGWPQRMFVSHLDHTIPDLPATPRRRVTLSSLIVLVCYAAALGCRENAVLFPAACWLGDRLCGTPRRGWIRWEHLAMGVILMVYLGLRYHMLGGFPLPAKPYLMPITDPEFPKYALDKISIYLNGLFLYIPIVPIGGRVFFNQHPGWFYGMPLATLFVLLIVWLAYGRPRSMLWCAVWSGLFLAPVIPVFASSHHLYLPGIGAVLLMTAGLAGLGGVLRAPDRRPFFLTRWLCVGLLGAQAIFLPAFTWAQGFAYSRGTLVEDIMVDQIIRHHRPLKNGDELVFINMPVIAYYIVPALKARLGLNELYGHVLTFSPDLLQTSPNTLEVLNDHRMRIVSPEDSRYFEGITGQMLRGAMQLSGQIEQGQPLDGGLFTVTPTRIDEDGIRELLFEFKKPLDSPEYHFFFGSPRFIAYPLDMAKAVAATRTPTPPATKPAATQSAATQPATSPASQPASRPQS